MADTIIKKDLLQKETVRLLDKKLVVSNWANRKFTGAIKKAGDTVTVQQFPNITLSSGTAGAAIADQDFTITSENLAATTVRQARVTVTDIDEAVSNLDLHTNVAERIAYGYGDVLDQLVASHYSDAIAANQLDDGDLATATNGGAGNGAILSTSNVYEAITKLRKALSAQNAFDDAALFISPAVTQFLVEKGLTNGTEAGYMDGKKGFVGKIAGFTVFETNNLPTSGSNEFLMAFDRNAIHLAEKLTQVDVRKGDDGFYDNVLFEAVYGSAVLLDNEKRIATFEITNG